MKITLMRHGKSSYADQSAMSCSEFRKWVDGYEAAGIIQEAAVPDEAKLKAKQAKLIVASTRCRSIQSAEKLESASFILSDPLFREADLPVSAFSFLHLKAPPSVWAVYCRCAWLLGYKGDKESMKEAKERAVQASRRLMELAAQHEHVLLSGHGMFNQFIARELLKNGWKGEKRPGRRHWSCTSYTYEEASDRQINRQRLS
ncbi:histidine phosphatase family protein [Pseudobacillus badius]|uniref:histidine phosphatase family protein n=1 Tax=Bacillus badius TaxID=1455 RepID=UPI0007B05B15|nr:histidine phosphatase family protein [Bacillus badius]KZN99812.1 hypothetical protein A4244_17630 [Bacillus badius]MED0666605.1 phosphoglycerate mutase family protein [Bacillus badius]OCS85915.1 hypothetical protein A6M11_17645 [Bacillus badius]OVE51725.1 histidine phosphatase family protein [Bacillus badius]TDW03142.1 broad specificity phosphatase PhoE [Bacillus badius]